MSSQQQHLSTRVHHLEHVRLELEAQRDAMAAELAAARAARLEEQRRHQVGASICSHSTVHLEREALCEPKLVI